MSVPVCLCSQFTEHIFHSIFFETGFRACQIKTIHFWWRFFSSRSSVCIRTIRSRIKTFNIQNKSFKSNQIKSIHDGKIRLQRILFFFFFSCPKLGSFAKLSSQLHDRSRRTIDLAHWNESVLYNLCLLGGVNDDCSKQKKSGKFPLHFYSTFSMIVFFSH